MKRILIPIFILLLALALAIGSQSFIGPCAHEDGSVGACHWAGRMLAGVGGLIAVLALLALALPGPRGGLLLAIVPASALGFMTPGTIVSICGMSTMRCQMLMRPASMVLCAFMLALALVGFALERRRAR